jgi:hypothetical protein
MRFTPFVLLYFVQRGMKREKLPCKSLFHILKQFLTCFSNEIFEKILFETWKLFKEKAFIAGVFLNTNDKFRNLINWNLWIASLEWVNYYYCWRKMFVFLRNIVRYCFHCSIKYILPENVCDKRLKHICDIVLLCSRVVLCLFVCRSFATKWKKGKCGLRFKQSR